MVSETRTPVLTGRFAPSPTGALHFGSVIAAVASWLNARAQDGRWLLRIDDLDTARVVPGAADMILRQLEVLGLHWDGPVVYQSRRGAAYRDALAQLAARRLTFPCGCSRREIGAGAYPGTCRDGLSPARRARSLRLRVGTDEVVVDDLVQGRYVQDLTTHCGDFVVQRADGPVAYHLAVVVDDAEAGVTEVVRGADLLESTPRQCLLQAALGLPRPRYAHIPVVLGADGAKLSKQTAAPPMALAQAAETLFEALDFLALGPPPESRLAPVASQLAWALPRWQLAGVGRSDRVYPSALAAANIACSSA